MRSHSFTNALRLAFALGLFSFPSSADVDPIQSTTPDLILAVSSLQSEYLTNPVGIDVRQPRLSWKLQSAGRGTMQTAFRLQVAETHKDLQIFGGVVWDSRVIETNQSVHIVYEGPDVKSGHRYYWRVKVWVGDLESEWSEPAFWEMGLLENTDWVAQWIMPATSESEASPHFRRIFSMKQGIKSARIYATSRGVYELYLNGLRVGDRILAPGFTSYNRRLPYQTYDVTNLVNDGENVIGAVLGDGWYRGFLGFGGDRNVFGERLGFLVQMEFEYKDGTRERVVSDGMWKVMSGPILSSDIYNGETYDARSEIDGWASPGYDESGWLPVEAEVNDSETLVADLVPPVRRIEEVSPIGILVGPSGETIVDMGQNLVGWVRLRVSGERGTTIKLAHAEALGSDGRIYTKNLRGAAQTDIYILKGSNVEWFEPHFTFHGFRYVQIDGYPGKLTLEDITGVVVHSDLDQTGTFETSDPEINQLQQNIVWSQKGNFLAIPTDCPQRDERLGWTGDTQIFAPTASFNMHVARFYTSWLRDLALDQYENGNVPWVIPDVLKQSSSAVISGVPTAGVAGWSDASIILPWELFLRYGDLRILKEQYSSMQAWISYAVMEAGEDFVWEPDFHFGDWLADTETPHALIATAYMAHSVDLMSRIASVIGLESDALEYRGLFERIRVAFQREFVDLFGMLRYESQTGYALALEFDLLRKDDRSQALERLIRDIRRRKTHLSTGFLGTSHLCPVLTDGHRPDVAYDLLFQRSAPSWLSQVKLGATTMWERWRGIESDVLGNSDMNSLNHYAMGSIGEWMYSTILGIQPDASEPGFKHVIINPVPDRRLTYARGALETGYGTLRAGWRRLEEEILEITVEIPPNSRATVHLPQADVTTVREDGNNLEEVKGINSFRQTGGATIVEIGSGHYFFSYALVPVISTRVSDSFNVRKIFILFLTVSLGFVAAYWWRKSWLQ